MHKKFNKDSVLFLKELVKQQLSEQLVLQDDGLKTFKSIKVKDSSKFSLPDQYNGDYPGFGNFNQTQGLMNMQFEFDLITRSWTSIELTSTKQNDQQNAKETIGSISKGDLLLRDLGYITPTYLKAVIQKGAYFLNRMPPQINVYNESKESVDWKKIDRKFKKSEAHLLDIDVLIYGKEPLPCRLIIERVSDDEYGKRLEKARKSAKRHGVGLSERHKIRCRYNTFITNAERKRLPTQTIKQIYYLRWQIELVFKTWKSFFEINKVKKVKKERLECQLLAKLLWILINWHLFQACNQYVQKQTPSKGVSTLKFFKRCNGFSYSLRLVILKQIPIEIWLQNVFLPFIDNTACEAPKGKITHYQIIKSLS